MGGLIGINDSWFRIRSGSLNSITLNGYAYYNINTENAPTKDSGLLLIFGSISFVCQLACTLNEKRLYSRVTINAGKDWSSWLKMAIE